MGFLLWGGFITFILALLAIDLGVFNRKAHVIGTSEALKWTSVWVSLALAFSVFVYFAYENHWLGIGLVTGASSGEVEHAAKILSGKDAFLQFLTGYVVEQSLSLDNVMVIALIFSFFKIPREYQHRVLFWGIIGVLVMRGIMIAIGAALIERFEWIKYVFGALLLLTSVKLMLAKHEDVDPDRNPLVKIARKMYTVTKELDGEKFFTTVGGKRAITPLFLVLLVVESTDLLFAVDSIPAVFAITTDPFLVFTSNVFAILGLRSLYFALSGMMAKFQYLTMSLVFVLAFVGIKLILDSHFHIPAPISLGVIAGILSVGVIASIVSKRKGERGPMVSDGH